MWLTAPENDYRTLLELPRPTPSLRVTVCMPVYNRVDLLARTVAALVAQSYPKHLMSVAIGDDGSDENVEATIAPFRDRLVVAVLRRERDGYGAGQARNLAAHHASGEVLVFIDSDCLPDPDLVLNHALWHHMADNLVVIGSRHGLDTSAVDLEAIADGSASIRTHAFGNDGPSPAQLAQTDYRGLLHRRTADTRHGDEAFRSLVSANFSIRRDRFLEIGGFDETFHRWGGEDIELGWRCHVGGLFTVPDDRAVSYHQLQDDLWDEGGRQDSARENAGVIQNKIPHHFYRKYRKGHIWEVPKVSVVIAPTLPQRLNELADHVISQSYSDWEMVCSGGTAEATLFAEMHLADPRFRVIDSSDPLDLIRAARGEYVAVLHGDATPEPTLIRQAVRRLDIKRRDSMVTSAYVAGGSIYRNKSDVVRLDTAWNSAGFGLPVFHMSRRREWSKAQSQSQSIGEAYRSVRSLSRVHHLRDPLVALRSAEPDAAMGTPLHTFESPRSRLIREIYDKGASPAALKAVAKYASAGVRSTKSTAPATSPPKSSPPSTPRIRYVGWTGRDNLGDEALLQAATGLLDWGEVRTSKQGDLLLLGGGTLINREPYLTWLEDSDSPRIERAVLGTGVEDPVFWDFPADQKRWVEWLATCAYVGVRGPISAEFLGDWGLKREVEVVGDPALLLEATAPRHDGLVVVSPCRTRGELWGGNDADVFDRLGAMVKDLRKRGHDVHMLAAHPDDDGPCLQVMRAAGEPDLPYLAGYDNVDRSLQLLASADLVVAERLHSAVLAAAVGTPFVGLEYRPKMADFAASVDMAQNIVRTDALAGLEEVVNTTLDTGDDVRAALAPKVAEYRLRLRSASERLRSVMGA